MPFERFDGAWQCTACANLARQYRANDQKRKVDDYDEERSLVTFCNQWIVEERRRTRLLSHRQRIALTEAA